MAIELTDALKDQIRSTNPIPTLALKIDGYDRVLGNVNLQRPIQIGDVGLEIGGDWVIGGLTDRSDVDANLIMSQGTTTKISQKLDPARGAGSSVTQMSFTMIDVFTLMTELISPNFTLTEILGRRVTVFSGCRETSFPEDYNIVFRGIVRAVRAGANTVSILCASTDEKKRIAVLPKRQTTIDADSQFRSAQIQDLLYKNRSDLVNAVTITYVGGATAGSEVVSLLSTYSIQVQIENGVSTATQIRKAVENSSLSNQLVEVEINGNGSGTQTTGSWSLSSDTTLSGDFSNFVIPADAVTTFAKIEDEIVEYTNATSTQLTGVLRASLGSLGAFHESETEVTQVVSLAGNGITLALKLMLSGASEFYAEDVVVSSFEYYSPTETVLGAIFFDSYDLLAEYGVVIGDYITITLATEGANNVVEAVIQDVGQTDDGRSYIYLSETLVTEGTTSAVAKFKSKYNVLPFGMAMKPSEVDIVQHEYVRDTFLPIFDLDIRFESIEDGKTFLDEEIYKPMACFSAPRQGRSSIIHTTAPMPNYEVVTLDLTTVENPSDLAVERSTTENFVNQIQFDYDYDVVTEKFLSHKNFPESVDRTVIDVGAKPFIIQSKGLRTEDGALTAITNMADRYLRRWQNGAEFIKGIKVAFSYGYQLEIGDVVEVDYTALKLSDFTTGTREGGLKLMEVTNKTIDFKTMEVTIDILSTIFGVNQRYGTISPASLVSTGSTLGKITLQKSWSTLPYQRESNKWRDYIGQTIVVRNDTFTEVHETVIRGFDNLTPQGMSIDPIPVLAQENWIVECIPYPDDTDSRVERYWKARHAFFSPQVMVSAGVSTTKFEVDGADIDEFFVGGVVRVHDYEYTEDSGDLEIVGIVGNEIEVESTMGFVPTTSHYIDLIGFPDQGEAYRIA